MATMQMPIETRPRPRLRPANNGPRVRREKQAIAAMLHIWCRDQHQPGDAGLCPECATLLAYAHQRLDNCVIGESKQPCDDCKSNCYGQAMRPRILTVMDYARPRLFRHNPLLALRYWLDRR